MSTQASETRLTAQTAPPTSRPARGRFVWHELLTTDLAAAQDFYTRVVGWTPSKWDGAGAAADYTLWMAGEAPVGGLMKQPEEAAKMGAPPSWLAYVEVPDVDAAISEATTLGASVLAPAMEVGGVGRFAVLRDPQGAVFAVIRSAKPMPR